MTAGLELDAVSVRFGGHVAVDGLSLRAPVGRITALIGPNGAGKTTTFNVCSGLQEPSGGCVRLFGHDVTRTGVAARAHLGLGRTFQRIDLYDSLTVSENLRVTLEVAGAGRNPLRYLFGSSSGRDDERIGAALERCALTELRDRTAGELSTGQRRMVELARALLGQYRMLLLDEPSSGLDEAETERLGTIVSEAVRAGELGVLVVEHDMSMVMSMSDWIYVLDFGVLICEGDPATVRASDVVRDAYLGTMA